MIQKKFRLKGKDINYIFRKQQIIVAVSFSIFWIPQYKFLNYNQWAINIPLKFSKKSSYRNLLKRIFYDFVDKNELLTYPFEGGFKRFFVTLNKRWIAKFVKLLQKDKDLLKVEFVEEMDKMQKRLKSFSFQSSKNDK